MPTSGSNKRLGSAGSPATALKARRLSADGADTNCTGRHGCLEQLAKLSTIVADTADFESIKEYNATDATTNPTLVLQAAKLPKYKSLLLKAIKEAQEAAKGKSEAEVIEVAVDHVLVSFGAELVQVIPGLVSTEISAELSFDEKASVERARKLIELYEAKGISKDRILIKIAATWEGVQAAKLLKGDGIHCNITLVFSLVQAVAAAEAGAFLISPFVGRILDWHKKQTPDAKFEGADDPGVKSVTQIYNYYKHFGVKTVVMAASFRNKDEILHLAGCDKLTISPKLLEELRVCKDEVQPHLSVAEAKKQQIEKLHLDEKIFRWLLNEDAMATEKLAEGIRNFAADLNKLRALIKENL